MTEAQSNARNNGTDDIRRSGRLSVYELFAAQVKRDPNAVAIEQEVCNARMKSSTSALCILRQRCATWDFDTEIASRCFRRTASNTSRLSLPLLI